MFPNNQLSQGDVMDEELQVQALIMTMELKVSWDTSSLDTGMVFNMFCSEHSLEFV